MAPTTTVQRRSVLAPHATSAAAARTRNASGIGTTQVGCGAVPFCDECVKPRAPRAPERERRQHDGRSRAQRDPHRAPLAPHGKPHHADPWSHLRQEEECPECGPANGQRRGNTEQDVDVAVRELHRHRRQEQDDCRPAPPRKDHEGCHRADDHRVEGRPRQRLERRQHLEERRRIEVGARVTRRRTAVRVRDRSRPVRVRVRTGRHHEDGHPDEIRGHQHAREHHAVPQWLAPHPIEPTIATYPPSVRRAPITHREVPCPPASMRWRSSHANPTFFLRDARPTRSRAGAPRRVAA